MKKQIINVLATAAVFASLVGCADKAEKDGTRFSVSSKSSSEELSAAAEQLVSYYSFHMADSLFDRALKEDPSNKKAQFYKDVLRPFMTMEGVLARSKITVTTDQGEVKRPENQMPNSPLKDFLMSTSKPDITKDVEAQTLLVELRDAFIQSSRSLKKKLDWELTLNINPLIIDMAQSDYEYVESCSESVFTDSEGVEHKEYYCGGTTVKKEFDNNKYERKIGTADILAFQQYYAGMALYLIPFTTWSIEGYSDLLEATQGKELSYEESIKLINEKQNLLKLRKDNALSFLPELGSSATAAVKWAIKYQDRLCPNGVAQDRKGYLFPVGLCILQDDTLSTEEAIRVVEAMLNGPRSHTFDKASRQYTTTLDVTALWKNPIQDLKTLIPQQEATDANCRSQRFANPTLNGILPNGDMAEVVCE